jgi:hypothetical protein
MVPRSMCKSDEEYLLMLRDDFAAKALPQAWAAEMAEMAHFNEGVTDRDMSDALLAKRAYRIADAMLKERTA